MSATITILLFVIGTACFVICGATYRRKPLAGVVTAIIGSVAVMLNIMLQMQAT